MTGKISSNKIQIFTLESTIFKEIVKSYPEYRQFLLNRASLRRTHWLRVFEENRHLWLLEKKVEEQKLINNYLGFTHRNVIFDYDTDNWRKSYPDLTRNKFTRHVDHKTKKTHATNAFKRGMTVFYRPGTRTMKENVDEEDIVKMRHLIAREIHEFKMRAANKTFNPAELKNKCFYISAGYMGR